jgi:hypothetical protein
MRNLRSKSKRKDNVNPIIADKLEQAEELWIKTAQRELHHHNLYLITQDVLMYIRLVTLE